jgi:hypothetical protein
MDQKLMIEQLASHARAIATLTQDVSDEQSRWKPDEDTWSILEVVNHLYDEECLDFRVRLDIILHRPDVTPPPINPQGWVLEKRYNERELSESLKNFLTEREASLAWLRSLTTPNWEQRVPTPWGSISAGDMFTAWVTHDTLHLRQLVELHHAHVVRLGAPYDGQYAGEW